MKRVETIGSFVALEANGAEHHVLILQVVVSVAGREDHREPPGFRTTTGTEVKEIEPGRYSLFDPWRGVVEVTTDDPRSV